MKKWPLILAFVLLIIALGAASTFYFVERSNHQDMISQSLRLQEELDKLKDPQHFAALNELQAWLTNDDTNTKYASSRAIERAYILQVKALRDGYLLPAYYEIENSTLYFFNLAYIAGKMYKVSPSNDSVSLIMEIKSIEPINLHPLPLNP